METFSNLDGVERMIYSLQSHIEKICRAFAEVRGVYDKNADDLGYLHTNETMVTYIREHISKGRLRLTAIDAERQLAHQAQLDKEALERDHIEQQRIEQLKRDEKLKIDNLMVCARSLGV